MKRKVVVIGLGHLGAHVMEILAISYIIGKLVATFVVMVFNFVTRKILIEGKLRAQQQSASGAGKDVVKEQP